MYFDDSHTEVKVTDVTHCDLETKSILKPPKARAPLQEVDLGNQITVEFDVIRKRRVSFAGVNKIKEFNSEAKSFSIYCTPAYEEKISTSSDSSALSTSVSGNINTLTKENDITILDDTMDLTDLSIVQHSAMDITGIKPQKPLQDVPDIFAPRSQDSGLFSSQQDINRPVFTTYEINNPSAKDDLEPNLLQTKPEILNKPVETPLASDPRKMLLNELLEESAVDFSVDNYLKANTLFTQNNCNIGENKCEIKKPLEVSGMDFTLPSAEHYKSGPHVQPTVGKKKLESDKINTKIISNNPSNLFGSLDIDTEKTDKLLGNVLEKECPKPLQMPRQSMVFPNFNNDFSKSTKIDASQMEFTEALPSKNFNVAQNNVVAKSYTVDRLVASSNISLIDKPDPAQNIQGHMNHNSNYCETKQGTSNLSQMEFTEALPSKYKYVAENNYHGDKVTTRPDISCMKHPEPSQHIMQSNMIPSLNLDESRAPKDFDASQMEFTEALPSKNIGCHNLVAKNPTNSSVLQMEHQKHFEKSLSCHINPHFNVDESVAGNNASQMEFTEALPSKDIRYHALVTNIQSGIPVSQIEHSKPLQMSKPSHVVPNFNIDEPRTTKSNNASLMEFTEALPSKNIGCQIEHSKPLPKLMPSHEVPNFNMDESRTTSNNNASQMEFTEALPSKNQMFRNFNIDESSQAKVNNLSQMEFTEALPSKNIVYHSLVANVHCTTSAPQIEHSKASPNSVPSHLVPNLSIDESRTAKSNNASQMEFTEALPSKNLASSNITGSVPAKSNNTTQMELTEALPTQNANLALNNVHANNYIGDRLLDKPPDNPLLMPLKPSRNKIQNDMIPNLNTDESKSVNCNDASQRQFVEGLSAELSRNNIIVSNYIGEKLEEKLNISHLVPEKPSQYDIQNDMFLNLNIEECRSLKKNNGPEMESPEDLSSPDVDIPDNVVVKNILTNPNISGAVHPSPSQEMIKSDMIPNLNSDKISDSINVSQMEFTKALPSNLPCNNIVTSKCTENRFFASSNACHMEELKINFNSEKLESNNYQANDDFVSCTVKVSRTSQMELTCAVSSKPSASNSSGVHSKISRQNVILDRENIPPSQDLNESNSMDVTEPSFTDPENGEYNLNSESNTKVIDKTTHEGDVSNMEFTEGLPMNVLNSGGKTEVKIQSVIKDVSQMEFTEALPTRNLQSAVNPVKVGCEISSQTVKNNVLSSCYNLQTSNMEFTEVLPIFKTKQDTINTKGLHEDISPSCDIIQNKPISSTQNLNDSCSMDVTDVENVPDDDMYKNLKKGPEISNKNKVNIFKDYSDVPELELKEKLGNENDKNSQNCPFLSGAQNNFVTERKTSSEFQSDLSQLEFTEALPVRNEFNAGKMPDIFSNANPLVNYKNNIVTCENDLLANSNMECTEFLQNPNPQHFTSDFEKHCKERMKEENEVTSSTNKGDFDNLCLENLTRTKNIVKHVIAEKDVKVNAQDSSDKHASCELTIEKNNEVNKPQLEFLVDLEQGCKNIHVPSKPYENIFPVTNPLVYSSDDTTQMEFTEAVQPQIHLKKNVKLEENFDVVSKKISNMLSDSEFDMNKISNASQMEFTEAITMPKCQSGLNQNVKDPKVNNNVIGNNSVAIETQEVLQTNFENNLDILSLAPSDKQKNIISSDENESELKNPITEGVKIADIDQIMKLENACLKDYSQENSSENKIIFNSSLNNVNIIKSESPVNMNMDSVTISSPISSDKDKSQELAELNKLKSEPVSSTQSLGLVSPMHVDEPSMSNIDRKENKVDSLRKIFENESKSDNPGVDFNTPKGKQFSMINSAKGGTCESSNKYVQSSKSSSAVVETLTVGPSEKKNLVHFNTPPVRITKRRKTMGLANPEESVQLLKSNTSDLALPLHDVSNVLNFQNASQRRGIFDEKKKSAYDPEKGKEEWNRLVKNDAFMKERSFHFVSPCKWKYLFRWPMELVLKIPDIEVNENSRKKNISLVSNISESDHISVFIHNRMKKNMSVILSEEWLNSHCKTIKDLLFTIKFIEEEYNKLEPLIRSMKYFYREFPFDFSSDRIIFKIVNMRKEFCFEVRIDVSYGQVKGKNIDVINHVGQISKTKVQQLFDQLQPNTERFYIFWQKLMEIDEL